eukprot:tig00000254_g22589.t1
MGQGTSSATERQMYEAAALKVDGIARRVNRLQQLLERTEAERGAADATACIPTSFGAGCASQASQPSRPFDAERFKRDVLHFAQLADVSPSKTMLNASLNAFAQDFQKGFVQVALATGRPAALSYRFLRSSCGPPREPPTAVCALAGLLSEQAAGSEAAQAAPRLLRDLEVSGGGAEFDSVKGLSRVFLEVPPGQERRLLELDYVPPSLASFDGGGRLGPLFMVSLDLLSNALELYYTLPPDVGRHMTDLASLLAGFGVEVPPTLMDAFSKTPGSNVAVLSFRYEALPGVDRVALFRTNLTRRDVPPLPHPLPELAAEGPARACVPAPRLNLGLSVPRSGSAAAAHARIELDYSAAPPPEEEAPLSYF